MGENSSDYLEAALNLLEYYPNTVENTKIHSLSKISSRRKLRGDKQESFYTKSGLDTYWIFVSAWNLMLSQKLNQIMSGMCETVPKQTQYL